MQCEKISKLFNNLALLESEQKEASIQNFVDEIRIKNSIFIKLSYFSALEFLKNCDIIKIKNQSLYQQNEYNEFTYIVLYGRVFLKNIQVGIFKECIMGETLAEEAIIEHNFTK